MKSEASSKTSLMSAFSSSFIYRKETPSVTRKARYQFPITISLLLICCLRMIFTLSFLANIQMYLQRSFGSRKGQASEILTVQFHLHISTIHGWYQGAEVCTLTEQLEHHQYTCSLWSEKDVQYLQHQKSVKSSQEGVQDEPENRYHYAQLLQ